MHLTNNLGDLLQLVTQLQQENHSLHQRLQQKNISHLKGLTKQIAPEQLKEFYKDIQKQVGHLNSVGILQVQEGVYSNQLPQTQQCGHCEILREQIKDISRRNKKLEINQQNLITNFNKVIQRYSQQIAKQMKTLFKFGQYSNAIQVLACVDIYNDFVEQTQYKLDQIQQENRFQNLEQLSVEDLNCYYLYTQNILKNIEEEYGQRQNSMQDQYSYQSLPGRSSDSKLLLLDIEEVLKEYGKLYENEKEVTDIDMDRLIEQKILIECAEINQLFLDSIQIPDDKSRSLSLEDVIERQSLIKGPQRGLRKVTKNKVEDSGSKIQVSVQSYYPPQQQQTPQLGGSFQKERRYRNDRIKQGSYFLSEQ